MLVRLLLPLLVLTVFVPTALLEDFVDALAMGWGRWLMAASLYAAAHGIRALRLAILAAPALSLRVRTVIFLHFHAAPVSFVLPFKLGELYRWGQFVSLSGSFVRPLVVMLIERVLDAVVLLALFAILLAVGHEVPAYLQGVGGLMLVVMLMAAVTVYVFQPGLAIVQAYIFKNHAYPETPALLRAIHSVRQTIKVASDCLRDQLPVLLALSVLIWLCEGMTLVALAPEYASQMATFLITTLSVAISASPTAGAGDGAGHWYAIVAVVTLISLWPVATFFYLRQTGGVYRRVQADAVKPLPLSSFKSSLRIGVSLRARRRISCLSR